MVWIKVRATSEIRDYYWNPDNEQTSWEPPHGERVIWIAVVTEGGRFYYWNTVTGKTTWDTPNNDEESSLASQHVTPHFNPTQGWQFQIK